MRHFLGGVHIVMCHFLGGIILFPAISFPGRMLKQLVQGLQESSHLEGRVMFLAVWKRGSCLETSGRGVGVMFPAIWKKGGHVSSHLEGAANGPLSEQLMGNSWGSQWATLG